MRGRLGSTSSAVCCLEPPCDADIEADNRLSVGDDGTTIAQLVTSEAGQFYGVNPDIGNEGGKLTLWSGPPSAPFTYLGFKAREI
jgi:hypothetical protein